jgi:hypothetical protein
VVPLLAVSCSSTVKKRCGVCWLACCGLNITGVWTEMVEFLCMCSNQLGQDEAQTTLQLEAKVFSFQHFSCAFLRTYMLVHCCKSDVIFELSFQFVCMNSHGSLMCRSLPPLGLYILVFSYHALDNHMALAETSSFFTTLSLLYAG